MPGAFPPNNRGNLGTKASALAPRLEWKITAQAARPGAFPNGIWERSAVSMLVPKLLLGNGPSFCPSTCTRIETRI